MRLFKGDNTVGTHAALEREAKEMQNENRATWENGEPFCERGDVQPSPPGHGLLKHNRLGAVGIQDPTLRGLATS